MSRLPTMHSRQGKKLASGGEHPLTLFRREMDDLFDRFFREWPLGLFGEESQAPHLWNIDIQEKENELLVRAEIPGFGDKDLDVRLEDNVLTIRAEREEKKDGEERISRFFRSVALPSGIDPEKVRATYHNGVLELHMPRPEGAKGKRIQVQGSTTAPHKQKADKGESQKAHK